jgi:hypothetical protein
MATPSTTLLPLTGIASIDGMLNGSYWQLDGSRQITWGFADTPYYAWNMDSSAYETISFIFDTLEAYINVDFVYAGHFNHPNNSYADITMNITDSGGIRSSTAAALGIPPNTTLAEQVVGYYGYSQATYPNAEGDVWFNHDWLLQDNPGSFTYQTVLHEIGHALGLKHPHDGGLSGRPTFYDVGLGAFDGQEWTMMSYDGPNTPDYGNAATPMYFDIIALQHLYGANTSNRADNSSYTLAAEDYGATIYDVGGNDTITAQAQGASVTIDLGIGGISYFAAGMTTYGYLVTSHTTVIENAVGGSGHDRLIGNAADNILQGNGGADTIFSSLGNDAAYGGAGNDLLFGGQGADGLYGGDDNDALYGALGDDVLMGEGGNDHVYGAMGRDTLSGGFGDDLVSGLRDEDLIDAGDGNDTIWSGAANDVAYGGNGNDVIYGSLNDDRFYGEAGADTFIFEAIPVLTPLWTSHSRPATASAFRASPTRCRTRPREWAWCCRAAAL